jgi:hypothetical protein
VNPLFRSCEHIHDEPYQHLFILWIGFRHQRDKNAVIPAKAGIQSA